MSLRKHGEILYNLRILLEEDETNAERIKLAKLDPELAFRYFVVFKDEELGKIFVELYHNSREYHHSAYFISEELGKPIKRQLTTQEVEELENENKREPATLVSERFLMENIGIKPRHSDKSWRSQNSLDNAIKIYEEFGGNVF